MIDQGLPTYYSWKKVPEGLHTKTQLLQERLRLAEDTEPVAIMRSTLHKTSYPLYSRENAIAMRPKREAKPRDYPAIFEKRYTSKRAAYLEASTACFEMNRYAKHSRCSQNHRDQIYALKNAWIKQLYEQGFCVEAVKVTTPEYEDTCWGCYGAGCGRCDYEGLYISGVRIYWSFRFVVDDRHFAWHQPGPLSFTPKEEKIEEREVVTTEKPVSLSPRKFAEAKALISWCLDSGSGSTDENRLA